MAKWIESIVSESSVYEDVETASTHCLTKIQLFKMKIKRTFTVYFHTKEAN